MAEQFPIPLVEEYAQAHDAALVKLAELFNVKSGVATLKSPATVDADVDAIRDTMVKSDLGDKALAAAFEYSTQPKEFANDIAATLVYAVAVDGPVAGEMIDFVMKRQAAWSGAISNSDWLEGGKALAIQKAQKPGMK